MLKKVGWLIKSVCVIKNLSPKSKTTKHHSRSHHPIIHAQYQDLAFSLTPQKSLEPNTLIISSQMILIIKNSQYLHSPKHPLPILKNRRRNPHFLAFLSFWAYQSKPLPKQKYHHKRSRESYFLPTQYPGLYRFSLNHIQPTCGIN